MFYSLVMKLSYLVKDTKTQHLLAVFDNENDAINAVNLLNRKLLKKYQKKLAKANNQYLFLVGHKRDKYVEKILELEKLLNPDHMFDDEASPSRYNYFCMKTNAFSIRRMFKYAKPLI